MGIATGVLAKRWWPKPPVQQRILAVLPIETVGQDQATGALGMGLMDTLTAKLQQASDTDSIQVVSSQDLRDQKVKTAEDARREFGTDFVLESSLQRSGQMLRINTYLVDSKTHRQIAARTIETDGSDAFQLQDQVVNAALDMLPVQIRPAQRKELAVPKDTKPAAYETYIRGRGYLQEYEKPENIDNAIAEFNQAIKIDPNYAAAYAGLGNAYLMEYDRLDKSSEWVAKASNSCQRALALVPDSVDGRICLGNVLKETGKYEEAAEQFRRAMASNPQSEDALSGLADVYTKSGNLAAAESSYKQAIALRPNYWGGYISLGLFYYAQGRYSDAVALFDKAILLAPDSYHGYLLIGGAYGAQGRYQDAVAALKRSVDLRASADGYNNLGYAYILTHQYPEAAEALEKALKLDDSHWEIWGNLGDALYWNQQRRAEAVDKYRKAISIALRKLQVNPKDPEILSYLAYYSAMIGDRESAFSYLGRALQLEPTNGEVLFLAASVYSQFNQPAEVIAYLRKAIDAGYSKAIIKDSPSFQTLQRDQQFRMLYENPKR